MPLGSTLWSANTKENLTLTTLHELTPDCRKVVGAFCYNRDMIPNFRSLYSQSETQAKIAVVGFSILLGLGFFGTVFFSSTIVAVIVVAITAIFFIFAKPTWALLGFAAYLPFEPFLLKWVSDEVYIVARYGSEMIIYCLVAVVLWRMTTGTIKFTRTPLDVSFVVLIVLALASVVVNTVNPWIAIIGLRQIFRFILLFYVTVYLSPSKKLMKILILVMFTILAFQSGLGYAQRLIGEPLDAFLLPSSARSIGDVQLTSGTAQFWDPGQRVFGTVGRYDQLGVFMAFFLLLLVAFLYERIINDKEIWPAWALLFLSVPVLGLTYSRSAWFGFLLGFLFIAIVLKKDKRVLMVAMLTPIVLAIYLSISGLAVSRLSDTASQSFTNRFFEAFSYARFTGEYYGLGRVYWMVHTVISVVPSSPLFGHGPGTYGGGAAAALGNAKVYEELGLPFGVYGTDGYIDNNWFSLWGEIGTLGLGAYLVMYAALFATCVRIYRESSDPETRALALGMVGCLIAVALNAFLATFLEARILAPYLWIFGGAVVAMGKKEKIV